MIPAIRNMTIGGIASIAVLTGQAHAQNERIQAGTFGAGGKSCGEFLQAVKAEKAIPHTDPNSVSTFQYLDFLGYVFGFLSGANWMATVLRQDKYAVGSSIHDQFVGEMAWLQNYCRQNPHDLFVMAMDKLTRTLIAREQKQ
jgi:hypothetical protein